jgi:diphosphomevalonate decarboxylase
MKEHAYICDFIARVSEFFPFVKCYDLRIDSENNFPTAAGFASSASGFAALTKAIVGELEEFEPIWNSDATVSAIARLGSGSAARSIPSEGGFVIWKRGIDLKNRPNQSNLPMNELEGIIFSSYAETLFRPEHWPEISIMHIEIEPKEKKISSRAGMKTTLETNPLYTLWPSMKKMKSKKN